MTDKDFIIELFCRVDDTMPVISKHAQAKLYPSESVTIGLVFALKAGWLPAHLKVCKSGQWNTRMLIETVLSMLTVVCHFKHLSHRVWAYFEMLLTFTG